MKKWMSRLLLVLIIPLFVLGLTYVEGERVAVVHTKAAAPAATDDFGEGYEKGDLWFDVNNQEMWVCSSNVMNAADWDKLSGTDSTSDLIIAGGVTAAHLSATSGYLGTAHVSAGGVTVEHLSATSGYAATLNAATVNILAGTAVLSGVTPTHLSATSGYLGTAYISAGGVTVEHLSATSAYVGTLNAPAVLLSGGVTTAHLSATSAYLGTANIGTANVAAGTAVLSGATPTHLSATSGYIATLNAPTLGTGTGTSYYFTTLDGGAFTTGGVTTPHLSATSGYVGELNSAGVTVPHLSATSGYAGTLNTGGVTTPHLSSTSAYVATLNAPSVGTGTGTSYYFTTLDAGDLTSGGVTTPHLSATSGYVAELNSAGVTVPHLSATSGYIATLNMGDDQVKDEHIDFSDVTLADFTNDTGFANGITVWQKNVAGDIWYDDGTAGVTVGPTDSGGSVFVTGTNVAGATNFAVHDGAGTADLVVKGDGKVGIGAGAPQVELHVRQSGGAVTFGTTNYQFIVQDSASTDNQARLGIIAGDTGHSMITFGKASDEDEGGGIDSDIGAGTLAINTSKSNADITLAPHGTGKVDINGGLNAEDVFDANALSTSAASVYATGINSSGSTPFAVFDGTGVALGYVKGDGTWYLEGRVVGTDIEAVDADIARVDVNRKWTANQDFSGVSASGNTPTDNSHFATKKYVDDNEIGGGGGGITVWQKDGTGTWFDDGTSGVSIGKTNSGASTMIVAEGGTSAQTAFAVFPVAGEADLLVRGDGRVEATALVSGTSSVCNVPDSGTSLEPKYYGTIVTHNQTTSTVYGMDAITSLPTVYVKFIEGAAGAGITIYNVNGEPFMGDGLSGVSYLALPPANPFEAATIYSIQLSGTCKYWFVEATSSWEAN